MEEKVLCTVTTCYFLYFLELTFLAVRLVLGLGLRSLLGFLVCVLPMGPGDFSLQLGLRSLLTVLCLGPAVILPD